MALNFIEDLNITGNVGLPDDSQLQLGSLADGDMKLYHVSGIGSYVLNKTDDLRIMNQANDKDIIFETDDGSGSTTPYITLDGSESNINISKHTIHPDSIYTYWGNANDFYIGHNATNTYLLNSTGNIEIANYDDDKDIIFQCDDGSGGVTTYLTIDGSAENISIAKNTVHPDSVQTYWGDAND